VRAGDEREADAKGKEFAADYGKTRSWVVRKIVGVQEILDAELRDGTEIYSAFIDPGWADVLMKSGKSRVGEWQQQNPGEDVSEATVQEVIDAWDNRAKENLAEPKSGERKALALASIFRLDLFQDCS
jgi:hypothetical protein